MGELLTVLQRTGHWRGMMAAAGNGEEVRLQNLSGEASPWIAGQSGSRAFAREVGAGRPVPPRVGEGQLYAETMVPQPTGLRPMAPQAPNVHPVAPQPVATLDVPAQSSQPALCSRCRGSRTPGEEKGTQVSFEDILLDL